MLNDVTTKVDCPYCGRQAELVHGSEIYLRPGPPQRNLYWLCKPCQAWTGVHQNSRKYAPKGSLANAELRKKRQDVHAAFDKIWIDGQLTRANAYFWLAKQMGFEKKNCHIGYFDLQQCETALALVVSFVSAIDLGMKKTARPMNGEGGLLNLKTEWIAVKKEF